MRKSSVAPIALDTQGEWDSVETGVSNTVGYAGRSSGIDGSNAVTGGDSATAVSGDDQRAGSEEWTCT